MDVDRGSLPNDGDANEDWSKLTPELIREVAKHLSPNDAAINLRLLNAETAAALRERYNIIRLDRCNAIPSRGVAIACAETWPGDAFARHWGCPEPWRSLPLPRRLRLLCLAASSHHPPSLDAALTHSGVRLSFEVLQAAAAAGDLNAFLRLLSEGCDCAMAALEAAAHCGHLHLLQWVWSDPDPNLHLRQAFGWARHQRRQHVPLAVSACAGGQGRVLTWLEGLLAAQHQQDQYQIQEQQWQCEQSQLQPQLQMQMQPNQQDQQPLAQGRPAAHAPSTAAAAAAGVAAAAGAAGGAHGIARCSIQISTGSEPGRSRPAAVPDAFALPVPWPRRVVGLTRYAFLDMAAAAAANGHVGILERLLQPGGPYGEYNTRTSRRDHEGCTPAVYASVLLPKVAFGCPHAALERLFRAWVPASLLGAPEESLFRHALLGTSPDWERNCDFALEMTAAGEAALLSVVERGRARGPRGGAEEWEDSEDSEEGGQEEDQEQQQQLEEGAAVRRAVREAVAAVRERAELDLRRVADRPGFLQRLHYLHARGVRVGEVETAFAEALAAAGDVAALAQLLDGWGVSGGWWRRGGSVRHGHGDGSCGRLSTVRDMSYAWHELCYAVPKHADCGPHACQHCMTYTHTHTHTHTHAHTHTYTHTHTHTHTTPAFRVPSSQAPGMPGCCPLQPAPPQVVAMSRCWPCWRSASGRGCLSSTA